jgi:16S rRNA pseudouridine516 synthase
MRLDKFLANQGAGSRKQVKDLLKQGLITVNGEVVSRPETKVEPETDTIALEGIPFQYATFHYFMLHKPAGCVSATNDNVNRTVLDLLDPKDRVKDLFPVGRLDKDTEGLLLLTNDGQLAHRLLSPGKHVDKTYYVELEKPISEADVAAFAEGIDIGDEDLTLPASLETVNLMTDTLTEKDFVEDISVADSSISDNSLKSLHCKEAVVAVKVTIHEGRFHQIKRMFHARNNEVVYLKRLSMGSLVLDESLPAGSYRRLTGEEVQAL